MDFNECVVYLDKINYDLLTNPEKSFLTINQTIEKSKVLLLNSKLIHKFSENERLFLKKKIDLMKLSKLTRKLRFNKETFSISETKELVNYLKVDSNGNFPSFDEETDMIFFRGYLLELFINYKMLQWYKQANLMYIYCKILFSYTSDSKDPDYRELKLIQTGIYHQNTASYLEFLIRLSIKLKLGQWNMIQQFPQSCEQDEMFHILKEIFGKNLEENLQMSLPTQPIYSFEDALKIFELIRNIFIENETIFMKYDTLMSDFKSSVKLLELDGFYKGVVNYMKAVFSTDYTFQRQWCFKALEFYYKYKVQLENDQTKKAPENMILLTISDIHSVYNFLIDLEHKNLAGSRKEDERKFLLFKDTVSKGIDHAATFLHATAIQFEAILQVLRDLIKFCGYINDKSREDMYRSILEQIVEP